MDSTNNVWSFIIVSIKGDSFNHNLLQRGQFMDGPNSYSKILANLKIWPSALFHDPAHFKFQAALEKAVIKFYHLETLVVQ